MAEKKVGYFLTAVGVLIMFFAVVQIVLVFTGSPNPIKIFENFITNSNNSSPENTNTILENLPQNIKDALNLVGNTAQTTVGFPIEILVNALNIGAFYLLMQFLLTFGYKIASLGVSLLKNSNVNSNK